jgi:hypothetical protein
MFTPSPRRWENEFRHRARVLREDGAIKYMAGHKNTRRWAEGRARPHFGPCSPGVRAVAARSVFNVTFGVRFRRRRGSRKVTVR